MLLVAAVIPYGLLAHVGSASVDIEGGMASGNRNRRQWFFQLQEMKRIEISPMGEHFFETLKRIEIGPFLKAFKKHFPAFPF